MDFIAMAKSIVEEGSPAYPSATKAEMTKRAGGTRRVDESPEGAFARFATTTDDGRALLAAYKVASGEDYRPVPASAEPLATSADCERLAKKAEKLCQDRSELSEARAFARVYEDPENRQLVDADRPAHYQRIGSALGIG
jgi:hypothetical protein